MSFSLPPLNDPLRQTFRTMDVPTPGLALYTLALYKPGSWFSFMTYTFPLSPQSLRREFTSMSTVYDVQGPVLEGGVTRVVDMYGISPMTFVIGGTTGQKRHSADGYLFTGRQSIDQVLELFGLFASLNQAQMARDSDKLYKMEFYDYYTQSFWEVVPVGPQGITQGIQAPTLQFYQFRLAGIRPVSAPIVSDLFADQVGQMFIAASATVAGIVGDFVTSLVGPVTDAVGGALDSAGNAVSSAGKAVGSAVGLY